MLVRFREDVIALAPLAVVILAGTNDIAGNSGPMTLEETEANFTSMAELARLHGIRVIFSSVLPVHHYTARSDATFPLRPPEKIAELNRWLRALLRRQRAHLPGLRPRDGRRKGLVEARAGRGRTASGAGRIRADGGAGPGRDRQDPGRGARRQMTDGGNDARCLCTPRRATRQGLRFRAASGIVVAAAFGSCRRRVSAHRAVFRCLPVCLTAFFT